jgi:STE24 endopeptidase
MTACLVLVAALAAPAPEDDGPVAVPEPSAKAMRFYRSGLVLWWVNQAWVVAVPVVIVASGLSARMRNLARRIGRSWFLTVGLFGVMYVILNALVTLPLDYCAGFLRAKEYDLAAEGFTLPIWLFDFLKHLVVTASLAFCLLWMPYLALRKMPRRWPWAVAIGYIPVAFGLMFLAPIVVDPLFDTFGPMQDKALEAKILALADRAGIDGGRVYEVDKGAKTKAVNAYVKGLLGTHRIVLWDTLLQKLDERQVLFVMGHEMGHFALGHVVRSILLGAVGVLALCSMVRWGGNAAVRRFGGRFGFDRLDDVASLPLALALGNVLVLVFSPIGLAYSRHQEHEADRFALELTRDNRAGALSFVAMQHENLSNPRPGRLSVLWRSTHPPLGERIDFCNTYRPWAGGMPLRYEGLFRQR